MGAALGGRCEGGPARPAPAEGPLPLSASACAANSAPACYRSWRVALQGATPWRQDTTAAVDLTQGPAHPTTCARPWPPRHAPGLCRRAGWCLGRALTLRRGASPLEKRSVAGRPRQARRDMEHASVSRPQTAQSSPIDPERGACGLSVLRFRAELTRHAQQRAKRKTQPSVPHFPAPVHVCRSMPG